MIRMIFHFNTYILCFSRYMLIAEYVLLESLSTCTLFILNKRSINDITHMGKNNLEQSFRLYFKQT